ncbi:MAG: hypothetical protein GXP54_08360 [Deltaproteobacteria bacterium]|nr:hypothetical protein [Deltaproteobacteria bacterium]
MIVRENGDRYDGSHRVVYYAPDEQGRCAPQHVKSEFDEQIESFYELREAELERLQGRLLAGEISSIGFFVHYCNMTVQDTAARMRTTQGRVRRHMTPEGFGGLKVRTLKKYAKLFDVAVADFFQFTHIAAGMNATAKRFHERLIQKVQVTIESEGDDS